MTKLTPYPYQIENIDRVLAEPTKAAIIASQVGRGKTLMASEIAIRAGWKRVLLIVIGSTFGQWHERLLAQSEGAVELRRMESSTEGRAAYEDFLAGAPGYFAATIQWLQAQDWEYRDKLDLDGNPIPVIDKKTGEPTGKNQRERIHLKTFAKMSARKNGALDAVIFDEAHQVCSRDSVGRKTLLTFGTEWKIALSATFSGNSFENSWSLTKWCWPDFIPAYWTWVEQWCKTEEIRIPGGKAVSTVVGEKEPEGSFIRSLPLFLKDESDEKAPEPIDVLCPSTPEQTRQFAELQEDLLTWVKNWDGDHDPLVVDMPAVLHSRLRQVALAELSFNEAGEVIFAPDAASGKLKALKGILELWGDQPAVLFTDSKLFANLTAERMKSAGLNVEVWTGDTSAKDRAELKRRFMEGEIQYLVATMQAMGTGTDGLQRVCNKLVWLSEPDGNPTLAEQALGRIFRPGRTLRDGGFSHVRLLMADSLDVMIAERLLAKTLSLHRSLSREALMGGAA